jgi:hypothetical protein
MKIEIKKLKFGLLGREGIRTFQCQLWVNDKHTADVNEDGNGGCLRIYFFNPECRLLNESANEWIKSQAKEGDFVDDLDTFIIDKVSDVETAKQLAKDQKKGLCWRKSGDKKENYTITKWTGYTLEQMLFNPGGRMAVKQVIAKIKTESGEVLNTNLPEGF